MVHSCYLPISTFYSSFLHDGIETDWEWKCFVNLQKEWTQKMIEYGLGLVFFAYASAGVLMILLSSCLVIFWAPAAAGGGVSKFHAIFGVFLGFHSGIQTASLIWLDLVSTWMTFSYTYNVKSTLLLKHWMAKKCCECQAWTFIIDLFQHCTKDILWFSCIFNPAIMACPIQPLGVHLL